MNAYYLHSAFGVKRYIAHEFYQNSWRYKILTVTDGAINFQKGKLKKPPEKPVNGAPITSGTFKKAVNAAKNRFPNYMTEKYA